jgi:hypothetical protein
MTMVMPSLMGTSDYEQSYKRKVVNTQVVAERTSSPAAAAGEIVCREKSNAAAVGCSDWLCGPLPDNLHLRADFFFGRYISLKPFMDA